jgi:pSer/pThr/pTyr-binding forkhead associated (FHA) protein
MNVVLVMFKADGTRREFPIKPKGFVIGRKNSCDLRIPLSSVSRKHCELRIEGEQVTLRDVGSSNGTFHNNIRVTKAVLAAGDEIVVGPVVFTVMIDGEPAKIKPVRSLVDSEQDDDGSVVLPADLLEQPGDIVPGSIEDTIHDDGDEDPIAALDRLAELEVPEADSSV